MMTCGATLAALLATATSAQTPALDAGAGWRAIAECARIGNAEQRHACMDGVIRKAGLLDPTREAEAARSDFGRDGRSQQPRAANPPSAPAPSPAAAQRPKPLQAEVTHAEKAGSAPDRLRTTVRSAQLAGNRRLTVVTADGAVWQQTQSEEFHVLPSPGDSFTVERGGLGGYRCTFGRSSVYRCRRAD
jgi:hypothetical protein